MCSKTRLVAGMESIRKKQSGAASSAEPEDVGQSFAGGGASFHHAAFRKQASRFHKLRVIFEGRGPAGGCWCVRVVYGRNCSSTAASQFPDSISIWAAQFVRSQRQYFPGGRAARNQPLSMNCNRSSSGSFQSCLWMTND